MDGRTDRIALISCISTAVLLTCNKMHIERLKKMQNTVWMEVVTLYFHTTYNYTVSQKNYASQCFLITIANVDRFSKFFHQLIHRKILYVYITKFPPHLQYVACGSPKSKNFDRILNKLLTCS